MSKVNQTCTILERVIVEEDGTILNKQGDVIGRLSDDVEYWSERISNDDPRVLKEEKIIQFLYDNHAFPANSRAKAAFAREFLDRFEVKEKEIVL